MKKITIFAKTTIFFHWLLLISFVAANTTIIRDVVFHQAVITQGKL